MRSLIIMVAAALAALGFAVPASAQQFQTRECSSWQYRPAECAVERNARDLRMARRIAGDCVPDRDWGLRRGTIYVANGCRAVFQYSTGHGWGGGPGGGYPDRPDRPGFGGGQSVRCESWNYRPARCALNTVGGVGLRNVVAGNCVQGQTWGWDRGGVWVNGGCRGDFIALNSVGGGYPGGGYPGGPGYDGGAVVECSSWNYRPARCVTPVGRGVRIVSVIAGECVEGQTWGWDGGGIWVNGGCRGRFRAM